jgi:hypothetical protein
MKTKTLLIAAAALAAGIMSSQAQVYSQNIVGYANVVSPVASKYYLLCNPLTTGNDVITNVLTGVPANSSVLVWNGAGYTQYNYSAKKASWLDSNGNSDNSAMLPPGIAFFYSPGAPVTNTFVGSIVAGSGSMVTNSLPVGFQLVGSQIPFAGSVSNTATVNLQVGANSSILMWDSTSQSFVQYNYSPKKGAWLDSNGNTADPQVSVGQGFFTDLTTATNWVQTAP